MSETEETPTPDKMNVAELRSSLAERGLDTKGTKPVLVARLVEALEAEKYPEEKAAEAAAVAEKMETEKVQENRDADSKKENSETKEEKEGEKKEGEERGKKRKAEEEPYEVKEDEPEIDEKLICLDWYNSDLHLRIQEDKMSAQPNNKDGWGYVYSGARATHGFASGKIYFEVKYADNLETKLDKEDTLHDLRVGWSTNDATMQLGEDDKSWCYTSSTGKMVTNKAFEEYGEKFEKGDVLGAFLDLDGDEVSMTFTKNGEDQGDAFQIPKADLAGKALFPHILAKNVKFEVNFGMSNTLEAVEAWKEPLEGGYVQVAQAAEETRVCGTPRIAKREECEMIMMIGLPASGKTTWVNKLVQENQDKHYKAIGTSPLISKMTVDMLNEQISEAVKVEDYRKATKLKEERDSVNKKTEFGSQHKLQKKPRQRKYWAEDLTQIDKHFEFILKHSGKVVKIYELAENREISIKTIKTKRQYPAPSSGRPRGSEVEKALCLYFVKILVHHGVLGELIEDGEKVTLIRKEDITTEIERKFKAIKKKYPKFDPFD